MTAHIYESIACPPVWTAKRNTEQAILPLKDGRLLLAWTQFYGPPYRWDLDDDFWASRIAGRLSADMGRTWGDAFVIQENDVEVNVMEANLLRLPSGEIALIHIKKHAFGPGTHRMYMKKSADEGRTWGEDVCILPEASLACANDRAVLLSTGRIVVPVEESRREEMTEAGVAYPSQEWSLCIFSDDLGRTWHIGEAVTAPKRGAMEPAVVELKDGRLLMIMRTQMGKIYKSYSRDGGEHWTEPEPMPLTAPESASNIKRIPTTGDLLLVFNHTYQPDIHHGGKRNPLSVAISQDEGETWGRIKNIEEMPWGYWTDRKGQQHLWSWSISMPSIAFVGDKAIIAYWYQVSRHLVGADDSAVKVKVIDVGWFYE